VRTPGWSSAEVTGRYALDRWRAVVGRSLFALDIDSPADDFRADIAQGRLGASVITRVSAGPQSVERTRRGIAGSRQPATIDLISVRSGTFRFSQHGREDMLRPGDCALLDRTAPYRFVATESCALTLNLEHDWLARWTADPAALTGRRIDGARGWGLVLSTALAQIDIDRLAEMPLPGGAVAEQIAGLLVLACEGGGARRPPDRPLVRRLHQLLRDHAHDSEFGPDAAATMAGISKRYLHGLFAREGESFGRRLMAERLERARALLTDPRQTHLPIGEVALRCGFVDQGHFTKRFRGRFGASPSAFRATVHS
jgi:AraC-like DNA-binding protein